jgi:hypothetical protein
MELALVALQFGCKLLDHIPTFDEIKKSEMQKRIVELGAIDKLINDQFILAASMSSEVLLGLVELRRTKSNELKQLLQLWEPELEKVKK